MGVKGHVYVDGMRYLKKGSWDLVTRVITRAIVLITTYNPNQGTYNLTTKFHDPPGRCL